MIRFFVPQSCLGRGFQRGVRCWRLPNTKLRRALRPLVALTSSQRNLCVRFFFHSCLGRGLSRAVLCGGAPNTKLRRASLFSSRANVTFSYVFFFSEPMLFHRVIWGGGSGNACAAVGFQIQNCGAPRCSHPDPT